jgi:hypothetical protein
MELVESPFLFLGRFGQKNRLPFYEEKKGEGVGKWSKTRKIRIGLTKRRTIKRGLTYCMYVLPGDLA